MKIEDFEKRILAEGLEPREVKLWKGQVIWFFCKSPSSEKLFAFNKKGHCYLGDGNVVFYTSYNVQYSEDDHIIVNGVRLDRFPAFDLDFGTQENETSCI